jgi:hypothetical protein
MQVEVLEALTRLKMLDPEATIGQCIQHALQLYGKGLGQVTDAELQTAILDYMDWKTKRGRYRFTAEPPLAATAKTNSTKKRK